MKAEAGVAPDYWRRHRAGDDPADDIRVSAAEAESYSGLTFVTLTPVREQ